MLPSVSCVCVTGKTEEHVLRFLPHAIECFRQQTYSPREMVIVSDREFPVVDEPGLRFVFVEPGLTLGELRNVGLDHARGDWVAQADCDDDHHPDRLAVQMEAARLYPDKANFFQRQLCYDWPTDTAFVRQYHHTFIHGTICHPRTDARYPAMKATEDTAFLANWPEPVVIANDPRFYVRFCYEGNTSGRQHVMMGFDEPWAAGRWHLCDDHREYLRGVVDRWQNVPAQSHSSASAACTATSMATSLASLPSECQCDLTQSGT